DRGDGSNVGVDCGSIPVRRIVRFDSSGTTYAWKAYLNLINGGRGWLTTYKPSPNPGWPAARGGGTAPPPNPAAAPSRTPPPPRSTRPPPPATPPPPCAPAPPPAPAR